MKTVTVELGSRSYLIKVGFDILDQLPALLEEAGISGNLAIVTDTNVAPLYADRVRGSLGDSVADVCVLPAGEDHKRLDMIEWLCGRFLDARLDRSSTVVALGGGVVGDVAGFAAATFMRGVRVVQVPTTVVAQVDSSVGGKTGVNHPLGKNTIGVFHQPSLVFIDMKLLQTLPRRELHAGVAEIIKHGVIADAALFEYLEQNAAKIVEGDLAALEWPVIRSCEIKAGVVSQDERESGLRAILNYGHTFGHAIESATEYRRYLHGEAVALGMVCAGALAAELGLWPGSEAERQRACIAACGLPTTWPEAFDSPELLERALCLMKHDKKARAGTLRFILPDRIGHAVQRTDITVDQVARSFESLRP